MQSIRSIITALGAALLGLLPINAQLLINPYGFSAGVSYTSKDSNTATSNGSTSIGSSTFVTHKTANRFTAGSSYDLTKVTIYAAKNGSPTQDFTAEIWTDGGTFPGSKIGTTSAAVNGAAFPASEGTVDFYPTATLTSGQLYYIVISASAVDSANYVLWHRAGAFGKIDTWNSTAWTNNSTARNSKFVTYSSP